MPKLQESKLKIELRVQRSRTHNSTMYIIAICKYKPQASSKRHAQYITNMQVIPATDIKEAVQYACKWFGLTDGMWD